MRWTTEKGRGVIRILMGAANRWKTIIICEGLLPGASERTRSGGDAREGPEAIRNFEVMSPRSGWG